MIPAAGFLSSKFRHFESELQAHDRQRNAPIDILKPENFIYAYAYSDCQMKPLRLLRWSGTVLSPRTRPFIVLPQPQPKPLIRFQSAAALALEPPPPESNNNLPQWSHADLLSLPSPPPQLATTSAKLSALHARLSLSPRIPLQILSRCLIDPSADSTPSFNNASLSLLGSDLLGLCTSESILCRFPRLPTEVVFAAMSAYVGPKTLSAISREWGVEVAAEPGGEVDPGLLQCRRV